jgi:RNA 3'-terminal phosphate cyclase (ATP)
MLCLLAAALASVPIEIRQRALTSAESNLSGAGCVLRAYTQHGCILSGSALRDQASKWHDVGAAAARMLAAHVAENDACADEFLTDQLILFMALADGESKLKVGALSLHTETAIHFARQITGAQITVERCADGVCHVITCVGIALCNPFSSVASE